MEKNGALHTMLLKIGCCLSVIYGYVNAAEQPVKLFELTNQLQQQGVVKVYLKESQIRRIMHGGNIAYYLLQGQAFPELDVQDRQAYLNDIIDLLWYFYSEAINKNQAFDEGTFVLVDPGFHIYNFLMDYVAGFNEKIKRNPEEDIANMVADNPYAYSRLSSHYTFIQYGHLHRAKIGIDSNRGYRHYGIDIRFDNDLDYNALPTGTKSHILFGKINEKPDMIFIKMEKIGIYKAPSEGIVESAKSIIPIAIHGTHFVQAQTTKIIQKTFSEPWVDLARSYIDFDDNKNNHKEHPAQYFIDQIDSILKQSNLTPDLGTKFQLLTNLLGIKFVFLMTQFVETGDILFFKILESFTRQLGELGTRKILDEIATSLQKDSVTESNLRTLMRPLMVAFDHCDLRTGREVLLTPCDLLPRFYYHELLELKHSDLGDGCYCMEAQIHKLQNIMFEEGTSANKVDKIVMDRRARVNKIKPLKNSETVFGEEMRKCSPILTENALSALINLEDEAVSKSEMSLLDSLNGKNIIESFPYMQLIRSIKYIQTDKTRAEVIQVLKDKLAQGLKNNIFSVELLPLILRDISDGILKLIVDQEIVSKIQKLRDINEDQLSQKIFGNRIVLLNNHESLSGNPNPRLLIKAIRGANILWQAVLEYGAILDIGSCDPTDVNSPDIITYEPYGGLEATKGGWLGSMLGFASVPTSIRRADLLKQCPQDGLRLVVTLQAQNTFVAHVEVSRKHALTKLEDAFPGVKYWISQKKWAFSVDQLKKDYPGDLARYILGLPKDTFTQQDVEARYARLLEEWNPGLYPHQLELVDAIRSYIKWAYITMLESFKK